MIPIGVQDIQNGIAEPDGKPTKDIIRLLQNMIQRLEAEEACCEESKEAIEDLDTRLTTAEGDIDTLEVQIAGLDFLPPTTVSGLPDPTTVAFYRTFVTDASSNAFYSGPGAGGGTFVVPVYSDGTDWRVG